MEISIREILSLFYRNIKFILLLTLIGGCSLFTVNKFVRKPVYTATVQLYVNSYNHTTEESLNELNYAQKIVNTYINFLQTQSFYQKVLDQSGVQYTKEELAKMTEIKTVNSTEIFEISVTSNSAEDSYKLAQVMQEVAPELIGKIKDNTRISVVDPVLYPNAPSGPRVMINTILGNILGFLLAIASSIIQKLIDVNVKDEEELSSKYSIPILGSIPSFDKVSTDKIGLLKKISKKKKEKVNDVYNHTLNLDTNFVITEAYKSLRTNLRYILRNDGCKTLLISSPTPGDGKSTTCTNVAITIAQTGARVLIIDCDLRKGRQHKAFGLTNSYGISDLISGIKSETDVIKESGYENLHVIPLGTIPPNPTELLYSSQMEDVLNSLKRYYDYILIDTPPVNVVSDALSLSKLVNGVLLVVKEDYTTHPNIETAISKYKLVDGKILGFVLNATIASQGMKSKSDYYENYND